MKTVLLGVVLCGLALGQKPDPSVVFEVASVKPSPPRERTDGRVAIRVGCTGGPGTPSPGQYTCSNAPVSVLIQDAWGLKPYQFAADPARDGERYDIAAKVPQGATKEQVRVMLQNLLTERFKVAWHFEKKEMPVYDLVVGKNGPKMKPSPPEEPKPVEAQGDAGAPPAPVRAALGPDGFPVPRRNSTSMSREANGGLRMAANDATMEQLANFLSDQLMRPVMNSTALPGKYDYALTFTTENLTSALAARVANADAGAASPRPPSDAPSLLSAVQEQLGLKLEQKKGSVDLFVVDHVEKKPSEN